MWTHRVPSSELREAWVRQAIASSVENISVKAWRAVEAQHVVSTLRLTDNDPEAQDLLERILDESKPPVPPEAKDLHYLLATPFRYPPLPGGSRFRAWPDPGVLYAAIERRTACAEIGYWRCQFLRQSSSLKTIPAVPQTVFQAGIRGPAINLREPPFDQYAKRWTDQQDYTATQALGRTARAAGTVSAILYQSVRDPQSATCVAVLDPRALRPKQPVAQQTWHLTVTASGAIWQRDGERFVFRFDEGNVSR